MNLVPLTLEEANLFVRRVHRHHKPTVGGKFAIGIEQSGEICGVAIVGRPVSRMLDDGWTVEVSRVAVKETIDDLGIRLRRAWCAETSSVPSRWTTDNPAVGQCAVTALIVQDRFGGSLVREIVRDGSVVCSHYSNSLPDGTLDLTREQFADPLVVEPPADRSREYVLSFPETSSRYELLKGRLHASPSCSMLYGAAWRAARAMGYRRAVTYTLPHEGGTSLRAAGWRLIGKTSGGEWGNAKRPRITDHPELKLRWEHGEPDR